VVVGRERRPLEQCTTRGLNHLEARLDSRVLYSRAGLTDLVRKRGEVPDHAFIGATLDARRSCSLSLKEGRKKKENENFQDATLELRFMKARETHLPRNTSRNLSRDLSRARRGAGVVRCSRSLPWKLITLSHGGVGVARICRAEQTRTQQEARERGREGWGKREVKTGGGGEQCGATTHSLSQFRLRDEERGGEDGVRRDLGLLLPLSLSLVRERHYYNFRQCTPTRCDIGTLAGRLIRLIETYVKLHRVIIPSGALCGGAVCNFPNAVAHVDALSAAIAGKLMRQRWSMCLSIGVVRSVTLR